MAQYRIGVSCQLSGEYCIEANSLEEAKKIFATLDIDFNDITMTDLEYQFDLDDMEEV